MSEVTLKKKKLRIKSTLPACDLPMLVITLVLLAFGLVMLMSASQAYAYYYKGDSLYYIKDQAVFALIGLAVMYVASRVNYRMLEYAAWPLYIVSVALLAITLFMPAVNDAHRWIFIAGFQFQPSEIAKFAIILLFSFLISRRQEKMRTFGFGYLFFMGLLAVCAVILLKQPHLSCTILVCLIGVVMMFVGGTRFWYFAATLGVGVPAGLLFLKLSNKMDYAMQRIQTWLDPFADTQDAGYQIVNALLAVGSGGVFGLGLGNSRQKHLFVPEPQNDFIFSIICEELGFVGALFVILLFCYFIFRGFSIAFKAKDKFGAMLALGITTQIGLQTLLNIGVVTSTIPNTGISLPFFSQGGTSLVVLLAEVGVLLSISRYSKTEKT